MGFMVPARLRSSLLNENTGALSPGVRAAVSGAGRMSRTHACPGTEAVAAVGGASPSCPWSWICRWCLCVETAHTKGVLWGWGAAPCPKGSSQPGLCGNTRGKGHLRTSKEGVVLFCEIKAKHPGVPRSPVGRGRAHLSCGPHWLVCGLCAVCSP